MVPQDSKALPKALQSYAGNEEDTPVRHAILVTLSLAWLLTACGGTSSTAAHQGKTDATTSADTPGTGDTGEAIVNIPDDTTRTSEIIVSVDSFAGNTNSIVVVKLTDQTPAVTTEVIAGDSASACIARRTLPDGNAGPPIPADAGLLRLLGGNTPVELEFQAVGGYPAAAISDAPLFEPGQILRLMALGGYDISLFDVETAAPDVVVITSPVFQPGEPLMLNRDNDLVIEWLPSEASEEVSFEITQDARDPNIRTVITCRWPSISGIGQIPASVLASLSPADADIRTMAISRETTFVVDWGPVALIAEVPARNADGAWFSTTVSIQ